MADITKLIQALTVNYKEQMEEQDRRHQQQMNEQNRRHREQMDEQARQSREQEKKHGSKWLFWYTKLKPGTVEHLIEAAHDGAIKKVLHQ